MLFAIVHNISLHKSHIVGLITIALPVSVKGNRKIYALYLYEYTNIRKSKTVSVNMHINMHIAFFYFSVKRDRTSETTNVRECIILLDYTVIFARYIVMMS